MTRLAILLALFAPISIDPRLIGHGQSGWMKTQPYALAEAKYAAVKDLDDKCYEYNGGRPRHIDYDEDNALCLSQTVDKETTYQCDISAKAFCEVDE